MHLVDLKAHQMMGFNFIGVLMDDLITAAATIHAAQIQANYTLWAASISSIVGAVGIFFAAWYAWQSGIKLHQHNNIIEAKREVYLDAIVKYQQLVNDLKLITYAPEKFQEIYLTNKKEFLISINKVQLICDSANKAVVLDLKSNIDSKIIELFENFNMLFESRHSLVDLNEKNELVKKEMDDFFLQNPKLVQMKLLDGNLHLRATELKVKLEKSKNELEAARIGYDFTLAQVNEKIENFEIQLNRLPS